MRNLIKIIVVFYVTIIFVSWNLRKEILDTETFTINARLDRDEAMEMAEDREARIFDLLGDYEHIMEKGYIRRKSWIPFKYESSKVEYTKTYLRRLD